MSPAFTDNVKHDRAEMLIKSARITALIPEGLSDKEHECNLCKIRLTEKFCPSTYQQDGKFGSAESNVLVGKLFRHHS